MVLVRTLLFFPPNNKAYRCSVYSVPVMRRCKNADDKLSDGWLPWVEMIVIIFGQLWRWCWNGLRNGRGRKCIYASLCLNLTFSVENQSGRGGVLLVDFPDDERRHSLCTIILDIGWCIGVSSVCYTICFGKRQPHADRGAWRGGWLDMCMAKSRKWTKTINGSPGGRLRWMSGN